MNPAKPVEQKKLIGTYRRDRNPAPIAVISQADLSIVPEHLGTAGRETWEVIRAHANRWIAPSDLITVRLVCEAMDRRAQLQQLLVSDGLVLFTDKGYAYQHPAVGMLATLEDQLRKWMSLLGLTPSDRSRLGVAEVKAASQLEQLMSKRAGHRNG